MVSTNAFPISRVPEDYQGQALIFLHSHTSHGTQRAFSFLRFLRTLVGLRIESIARFFSWDAAVIGH
jgi:hypothetical protein